VVGAAASVEYVIKKSLDTRPCSAKGGSTRTKEFEGQAPASKKGLAFTDIRVYSLCAGPRFTPILEKEGGS